jgi:hypothetical protein
LFLVPFCHSVKAKRDDEPAPEFDPGESSILNSFWICPEGYNVGLRNLKVIYDQYDIERALLA